MKIKQSKIYLLDAQSILRDGLKAILTTNPRFKVVGEESNPEVFLKLLPKLEIDLLVLEISFPGVSGLDLIKKIRDLKPLVKIVILSMHDNPEYIFKSLKLGVNAYLPKKIHREEFIDALKQVLENGNYFPDMHYNHNSPILTIPVDPKISDLLTVREVEILKFMSKGMSSKQIAERLSVSPRTVETHRVNIMKKMSTSNGAETVALAIKLKLIHE